MCGEHVDRGTEHTLTWGREMVEVSAFATRIGVGSSSANRCHV